MTRAHLCFILFLLSELPTNALAHDSGGFPNEDIASRGLNSGRVTSFESFVNFEIAPVHPLDINSGGTRLAACNTADNRIEVFSISELDGSLEHVQSIPVGYSPVSVRFLTDTIAWVVNHISDSISVVDLDSGNVKRTIHTADEPEDVVFVSDSGLVETVAAVSCSNVDLIQVFRLGGELVGETRLEGEDPRALTTNGVSVFAAIFESGNGSTIIGGSLLPDDIVPKNALNDPEGPYGGVNPPRHLDVPGDGWRAGEVVVQRTELAVEPPRSSLIVKKDAAGVWRDDNGIDWSAWINGDKATRSARFVGWDLLDNDVAKVSVDAGVPLVDSSFGASGYVTRQMNICMALAYNRGNNTIVTVGTDATNELRFEPNITGTFLRVLISIVDATSGDQLALVDLNSEHLDIANGGIGDGNAAYSSSRVPQEIRDQSIGDPRGIAFSLDGRQVYVAGMGSNNVVVIDASTGKRLGGTGHVIEVGEGPTGIRHHPSLARLYVLNRFESSVVVIETSKLGQERVIQRIEFFDPTPEDVKRGRTPLYGTHEGSGLGHIACASCHIDAQMDRLAWDLGNPAGSIKEITLIGNPANPGAGEHNLLFTFDETPDSFGQFHPMKGPMTTQTLQDIIGKEPHHWRGDKDGLEEFAGAFFGLQGADESLGSTSMADFEAFLSTVALPPNPFRALDNSLPGGPNFQGGVNPLLPMDGFVSTGKHSPPGQPLPPGNAWNGFVSYVNDTNAIFSRCVDCHTLPLGASTSALNGATPIAPGPHGEAHLAISQGAGTVQPHFKVPQLRNQFEKEGFFLDQGLTNPDFLKSRAGFGLFHDGTFDGLVRFLSVPFFFTKNEQELANLTAFLLCIRGDGFNDLLTLPGAPTGLIPPAAEDTTLPPSIGQQLTVFDQTLSENQTHLLDLFIELAQNEKIDLIAKGVRGGIQRGWYLARSELGSDSPLFMTDLEGDSVTFEELVESTGPDNELTFTVVPLGLGVRMGIDRDNDGFLDFTEIQAGADPADPDSTPAGNSGLNGSCIIATASYGTPLHEDIDVLREFRDEFLLTNSLGVAFTDAYYRLGPGVAHLIANNPKAARVTRIAIKAFVVSQNYWSNFYVDVED